MVSHKDVSINNQAFVINTEFQAVFAWRTQSKLGKELVFTFMLIKTISTLLAFQLFCIINLASQNLDFLGGIPPESAFEIDTNNKPIELAEVIVSQQRTSFQNQTITDIDKSLRVTNSSQDLLQLVPGLFIAQHAGGGKAEQIFLRGFDSDHGTDFNISIDGLPVNMVSHAHGQGYADFHFVIPETVGRLKVYKGPYTTRFGDFATSGTGEFFTKNSFSQDEIKLEAGMFDTYRCFSVFNLPPDSKFFGKDEDAYIAAEYVFTNAYFTEKQNFNRGNLFAKYSASLSSNSFLQFSASTFAADWNASGQIPQRAVDSGLIDIYGSINPNEGGEVRRSNATLQYTSSLKNNATLKNQVYYVNYYFNLFSDFTFFLNDPVNGDEINQTDDRHIFGYSGTLQKEISVGRNTFATTFGISTRNDLTHISLRNSQKRTILDTIVSGKVYQQNSSAYIDIVYDLNPHLSINAGIRNDYFLFNFKNDIQTTLPSSRSAFLLSPKLNFAYTCNDRLELYLKSGIGFHSNDARAVVLNQVENILPKAYGAEIGSEFKIGNNMLMNIALWELYLQSELVYIGDEGTVETNNPTQRIGMDVSIRYQLTDKLYADTDFNYNHGRIVGLPRSENFIPLAPRITSTGGLTFKQEEGINASLRYKLIDSRPANENNSVTAKGYCLLDATISHKSEKLELGLSAENILNTSWNQAQFATESRLFDEPIAVEELHFTPGTPFFVKGFISFKF